MYIVCYIMYIYHKLFDCSKELEWGFGFCILLSLNIWQKVTVKLI